MNHLSLFHSILMGIVQGLTEYLPISSSAHLRLVPVLFKFEDPGAGFSAVIQLGTVMAVIIYFWKDLSAAFIGWLKSLTGAEARTTHEARMGWAVLIGTLPVIVAGLLLKKHIETSFRSLYVIAIGMIVMGLIMFLAERFGAKRRKLDDVMPQDGVIPGLMQCLALAPGMSRSGSTITGAFLSGFDREAATRFSFLMSVPSVAGAGFYELFKARHELTQAGIVPTVLATVVSFFVGWATIKFLLTWISKNGVAVFTVYRVIVGVLLLTLLVGGNLDPMAGADAEAPSTSQKAE